MKHLGPSRAFTLIELLVVVAIISILAAILLPALQKAKGRTKITACLNNQKQAYVALGMYGSDMDEYPTNYSPDQGYPGNWGDESCGRWQGGPPSAPTATYWPDAAYPAADRILNAKYTTKTILSCAISLKGEKSYSLGGWYFGMRPWDSYQTGTFVYNGPHTAGGGLGNNADMSGMYLLTAGASGGSSYGISYKSDTLQRGASRFSYSKIPFLGCPSLYRYQNGAASDYKETHHLGSTILPLAGQTDSRTNGWIERNYAFGDGHARLVYLPKRSATYVPTE